MSTEGWQMTSQVLPGGLTSSVRLLYPTWPMDSEVAGHSGHYPKFIFVFIYKYYCIPNTRTLSEAYIQVERRAIIILISNNSNSHENGMHGQCGSSECNPEAPRSKSKETIVHWVLWEEDRSGRMELMTCTLKSSTERGENRGLRQVVEKQVCDFTGSAGRFAE